MVTRRVFLSLLSLIPSVALARQGSASPRTRSKGGES
jgi:hypothetical protein